MTQAYKERINCSCGNKFEVALYQSINATSNPELKEHILQGKFHRYVCPRCGQKYIYEIPFLYNDVLNQECIWVYPQSERGNEERIRKNLDSIKETLSNRLPPFFKNSYLSKPKLFVGLEELIDYLKSKSPDGR